MTPTPRREPTPIESIGAGLFNSSGLLAAFRAIERRARELRIHGQTVDSAQDSPQSRRSRDDPGPSTTGAGP